MLTYLNDSSGWSAPLRLAAILSLFVPWSYAIRFVPEPPFPEADLILMNNRNGLDPINSCCSLLKAQDKTFLAIKIAEDGPSVDPPREYILDAFWIGQGRSELISPHKVTASQGAAMILFELQYGLISDFQVNLKNPDLSLIETFTGYTNTPAFRSLPSIPSDSQVHLQSVISPSNYLRHSQYLTTSSRSDLSNHSGLSSYSNPIVPNIASRAMRVTSAGTTLSHSKSRNGDNNQSRSNDSIEEMPIVVQVDTPPMADQVLSRGVSSPGHNSTPSIDPSDLDHQAQSEAVNPNSTVIIVGASTAIVSIAAVGAIAHVVYSKKQEEEESLNDALNSPGYYGNRTLSDQGDLFRPYISRGDSGYLEGPTSYSRRKWPQKAKAKLRQVSSKIKDPSTKSKPQSSPSSHTIRPDRIVFHAAGANGPTAEEMAETIKGQDSFSCSSFHITSEDEASEDVGFLIT